METVLKTVVPATVPWVRIPPLPPVICTGVNTGNLLKLFEQLSVYGKERLSYGEVPKWLKGTVC